ncbi:L,D-transpeptidase family protein [Nocardiopsis coralliicola]
MTPGSRQRRRGRLGAAAAALAFSAVLVPLPESPASAPAEAAQVPSAQAPAAQAPAAVPQAASDDLLRNGDKGAKVKEVQQQLIDLGYWIGEADGQFGTDTVLAVQALQKAAGIDTDGVVGPATRAEIADGTRPSAESSSGEVVEIDLDSQLLMVVSDGDVEQVFSTSTGSGETYESEGRESVATTPTGSYQVFREVDSWDPGPLGALYRPKYFNGGIAVHGYTSVPTYPASHGCARVGLNAMDWLWDSGKLEVYDTVLVH